MGLGPIFLWWISWSDWRWAMSRATDLEQLLAPVVAAQGCELWGLEFSIQGRRGLLRLYIDTPQGVTLEDCERVSRQVSAVLDVEDPIASAYTLEVSSPGMDRPLYTPAQFARYVGQRIAVRLRAPYEGRRRFQGVLNGLEEGDVVLQVEDTEYLLPLESIDKANVVPVFDDSLPDGGDKNAGLREGAGIDEADLNLSSTGPGEPEHE
jgi:ribosome maturation factor RimP